MIQRDRRRVRRPAVARHAPDRAAHAAAAAGLFVLREPIIGLMQRGQFDPVDVGEHRPRPRRPGDRAGRVLGLPVHDARLLRPPGHAHAVRAQRRREPAQHRARLRCSSGAGACSGSASPTRSPTWSPPAWALQVMSYKVPAFSVRAVASRPVATAAGGRADGRGDVVRHPRVPTATTDGTRSLELVVGGLVGLVVYVAVLLVLSAGLTCRRRLSAASRHRASRRESRADQVPATREPPSALARLNSMRRGVAACSSSRRSGGST